MRQSVLVLVVLVLVLAPSFVTPASATAAFVNNEVRRFTDLSGHVEDVSVYIKATNTGSNAASTYAVSIPGDKVPRLSLIEALVIAAPSSSAPTVNAATFQKLFRDDEKKNRLIIEKINSNDFEITFASPVKPDTSVAFYLFLSFSHTLQPLPAYKTQDENQLVLYTDNVYFYSPYATNHYRSSYKLQSSHIESYTRKHASLKGDEIEYGPFSETINARSHSALNIHYQNNSPFITVKSLKKEVEVSHWGNIAITEWYELVHTGAVMSGEFSRFDYQRSMNHAPAAFHSLKASLPLSATGIYYRDVIGNISTSHVRKSRTETVLEIESRFPMFGGWKTEFEIGYNIPSIKNLFLVDKHHSDDRAKTSNYLLNVTFGSMFVGALPIDEAEIRVILPEGSSSIEWATPFAIDSADREGLHLTHLDTTGRPVLTLRKSNVGRFHNQAFQVGYHFQPINMLREPALVIAAAMAFFVLSMLYYRVELGVGHEKLA